MVGGRDAVARGVRSEAQKVGRALKLACPGVPSAGLSGSASWQNLTARQSTLAIVGLAGTAARLADLVRGLVKPSASALPGRYS